MTPRRLTTLLLALPLVALACGAHKDNASTDDVATDTVAASESSAQATGSVDDVIAAAPSSDVAATVAVFAAPSVKLWPAGCVARVPDEAACTADQCVVHVTFHDCTGPRGLLQLSGNEDVTLTRSGDTLHVVAQGISLTANGHPFTRTATADVTFGADGSRTAQWDGHATLVRADGLEVDHTGSRTISFDPATGCRTVHGTGVTTRGRREIDTTLDDVVCRSDGMEACPKGTETHVHRFSGKTVTLTFDGSTEGKLTRDGQSIEVPLVCSPSN